jgi:hypothetical protein
MILLALLALVSLLLNFRGLQAANNNDARIEASSGHDTPWCVTRPKQPATLLLRDFSANATLTTTATAPQLFHCGGYALNRNFQPVLQTILPEYTFVDLRKLLHVQVPVPVPVPVPDDSGSFHPPSHPWDIYVSNYQLNECQTPEFYQWLHLSFAGKVVFWTPEDATNYKPIQQRPNNNYYELGPGPRQPNRFTLTFLQAAFWAQLDEPNRRLILDASQKPQNSGEHFLIYAHSHCVGIRQRAFRLIANTEDLPTAHFGGRCDGGVKNNTTKATKFPNKIRLANWEDNRGLYQNFRFCLVMEHVHVATPGYITEKILVAFWAGCLPIYWGSDEILDIFNRDAFIFWNVDDPQPALERLAYLERNRTAYTEVMTTQPILAPGALEKYFSLDDKYGGGALKEKIRGFLGLEEFRFVA